MSNSENESIRQRQFEDMIGDEQLLYEWALEDLDRVIDFFDENEPAKVAFLSWVENHKKWGAKWTDYCSERAQELPERD